MRANQSERLHRIKEFEVSQNRGLTNQIETMIAEFDRIWSIWIPDQSRGDACSDQRPDAFCVSNICEGGPRAPCEASAISGCP